MCSLRASRAKTATAINSPTKISTTPFMLRQDYGRTRGLGSNGVFARRIHSFLAVFCGTTRLGSFKSQAPISREVPSSKPQHAALNDDHIARASVWSLRFEASLELGAWSLELGVLVCATPPKTAKNPPAFVVSGGNALQFHSGLLDHSTAS